MSHYASLITAEKPLEAHREYMRRRSSVVTAPGGRADPDLEQGRDKFGQPDQARFLPDRPSDADEAGPTDDDPYWEEYRQSTVQRCA